MINTWFLANTRFVTDAGIKSFRDFSSGEEVTFLDENGFWNTGVVCKNVGVPKLYEFMYGNNHKLVECLSQVDLSYGGDLQHTPRMPVRLPTTKEDCLFFTYGFALGLGREVDTYTVVRLSDSKYLNIFRRAGIVVGSRGDNEWEFAIHGTVKTDLFSHSAYKYLCKIAKYWLVAGILSAISYGYSPGIYTQNPDTIRILNDLSCLAGFHVINSTKEERGIDGYYYIKLLNGTDDIKNWKLSSITESKEECTLWSIQDTVSRFLTLEKGLLFPL